MKTEERLTLEMEFIRRRETARRNHETPRCYGVSSDALVAFALRWGPRPSIPGRPYGVSGLSTLWLEEEAGLDYPRDRWDLDACELTYVMAPAHLQELMLPVLEEFRSYVLDGRNRYGERYEVVK